MNCLGIIKPLLKPWIIRGGGGIFSVISCLCSVLYSIYKSSEPVQMGAENLETSCIHAALAFFPQTEIVGAEGGGLIRNSAIMLKEEKVFIYQFIRFLCDG